MRKTQVLKLVRQELKNYPLDNIEIEVLDKTRHTKDDFWHVPVRPSVWPERTIVFYDVLAEVETELSMKHHVKVLLDPTLPGEDPETGDLPANESR